jgi:hypothetical protein
VTGIGEGANSGRWVPSLFVSSYCFRIENKIEIVKEKQHVVRNNTLLEESKIVRKCNM